MLTVLQADHFSQKALNEPRESVRISTKALFDQGLFIIDVKLMPWGCAVWPACEWAAGRSPVDALTEATVWMLGYAKEWPHSVGDSMARSGYRTDAVRRER